MWFTGRPWQPGLLIAHLDASPWNAVWADGALLADGGEPTFQRMLPWAADLERSGNEVAELPAEFWRGRAVAPA